MSQRPWRLGLGLIACLTWTCFLGVPLAAYHLSATRLRFGDHLHAAILFCASNCLVFWLCARPSVSTEKIFVAEIIPDDEILTPFRQDEP